MRLDLSQFQPAAYAELRDKAPFGLTKRLPDLLKVDGDTVTVLDMGQYAATMIRYLVQRWQIADIDARILGEPSGITEDSLEWIEPAILTTVLQACSDVLNQTAVDPNVTSASSIS